ncbi:MAG: hypothetical protein J3R72DRAFT_444725 [Linnemannia gamsii]|nr:MAG: hypothetical protein J3R72DRAFT_444725 [Linnemannia gamsii]
MGLIKLDCIAVNHNNTAIYGIGNAFIKGATEVTIKSGSLVIVRSYPNPTSFQYIRWEIIGATQADKVPFYWEQGYKTVDCAVSRMGVFTAMAQIANKVSPWTVEWKGVTFDPAKGWADGWNVFTTKNDYVWQNVPNAYTVDKDGSWKAASSLRTTEAIYMQQPVKAVGAVPEDTVRDRFVHGLSNNQGDIFRLGSFGPLDSATNDTVTTWNLTTNSAYVRLGPTHAHIYYSARNTITSYPLANISAPMPQGVETIGKEGLTLDHILPGTHEGNPFLVCIGKSLTQSPQLYFINNYLNNTAAGPVTISPSYKISSYPDIRPLQFVNIQYPASDNRSASANKLVFGISIDSEGQLYGINLAGNQNSTDPRPGQSFTSGFVNVEEPYDSFQAKINAKESNTPREVAGMMAGLLAAVVLCFLLYKFWKKRNRQLKSEADAAATAHPLAAYQPPAYEQGTGQRQGEGQDFELTTPTVPYTYSPSSRHDGPDAPPAYRA